MLVKFCVCVCVCVCASRDDWVLILICNQYYVYECLKNAAALVFVMLRSISNSYFNQSCFHSRNEDSFAISCHILLVISSELVKSCTIVRSNSYYWWMCQKKANKKMNKKRSLCGTDWFLGVERTKGAQITLLTNPPFTSCSIAVQNICLITLNLQFAATISNIQNHKNTHKT